MSADLITPAAQSDKGVTAKSVEAGARVYAKGKEKAKVVAWDPANPVDSVIEGERQLEELLEALEADDLR